MPSPSGRVAPGDCSPGLPDHAETVREKCRLTITAGAGKLVFTVAWQAWGKRPPGLEL